MWWQNVCRKPSAEFSLLATKQVTCGFSVYYCSVPAKQRQQVLRRAVAEHTVASAQAKLWSRIPLSSECRLPATLNLHVQYCAKPCIGRDVICRECGLHLLLCVCMDLISRGGQLRLTLQEEHHAIFVSVYVYPAYAQTAPTTALCHIRSTGTWSPQSVYCTCPYNKFSI